MRRQHPLLRERNKAVFKWQTHIDRSHWKIVALLAALGGVPLAAEADESCRVVDVCPVEAACADTSDCSALEINPQCESNWLGVRSCKEPNPEDRSLAIARCETQVAAKNASCKALREATQAACQRRQENQARQCASSPLSGNFPDLCKSLNELANASTDNFEHVRSQGGFSIGGMKDCRIDSIDDKQRYIECTVLESKEDSHLVDITRHAYGLFNQVEACLGRNPPEYVNLRSYRANGFSFHFGPSVGDETLFEIRWYNSSVSKEWVLFFDVNGR
jgi:hypothetical protein